MTARTSLPPLDAETLAALESAEGYAVIVVRDGRARVVVEGVVEMEGAGAVAGTAAAEGVDDAREIPWTASSAVTLRAPRPATTRAAGPDSGAYDFLWGSTVHGHVSTAAVPVQHDDGEPAPAAPTAASTATIVPDVAPTVVPDVVPSAVETMTPAAATMVPDAARSGLPPERGQAHSDGPRSAVLSTGQSIRIDGTVVFGRSPGARAGLHENPLFVAVPSPLTDISRNHFELWLEGDVLLARDLGSTNGTVLHRAGERSVRVPVEVPTLVRAGDVYDLGEGVTVSFGPAGGAS